MPKPIVKDVVDHAGLIPLRSLGPMLNKMGEQWQREAALAVQTTA